MCTSNPIPGSASQLRVSVVCVRLGMNTPEVYLVDGLDLPSAAPGSSESLDATANRVISTRMSCTPAYTEQLYTFSTSSENGREITVSYLALFAPGICPGSHWVPLHLCTDIQGTDVIAYAMTRLRAKLEYTSIGFHLVPAEFTLAELQHAYELVLGEELDKRNFRRRMTTSGMLTDTGEKRREGPHRPAVLYRFSGQSDRSSYLTPPPAGASA